jgi:endonuclease/exonuclease/phosphatase family metal-dependent hydrolase
MKLKKLALSGIVVAAAIVSAAFVIPFCIQGMEDSAPPVNVLPETDMTASPVKDSLKLMTLNVAHGRGVKLYRIFNNPDHAKANLDDIVEVIKREDPDVVALQEADGPSVWSGNFNHISYLSEKTGMPYSVRGEHVKGLKLSYGTALLSKFKLEDSHSITFAPSPPTFPKGAVICTIKWPGKKNLEVDVMTVHLDFLRASARKSQVQQLVHLLSERSNPLILLGDFNCNWQVETSALRYLVEKFELIVYQPENTELVTYPGTGKRLDWIVISKEMTFDSYEILPDSISDHRSVVAEVTLAK